MAREGPLSTPDLAQILGVSGPTLLRMLKEQADQLVVAGRARRRRYAWRRALRGDVSALPLYAIDREGDACEHGALSLVQPQGTHCQLDASMWPVPAESAEGWWDGLPYPLLDMRPQGYMGRQFARAHHRQLGLDDDPQKWSDDDVLFALSREGSDLGGNLIVGHAALDQWQQGKLHAPELITQTETGSRYAP